MVLAEKGETYESNTTTGSLKIVCRPEGALRTTALRLLKTYLVELGLTPASIRRVDRSFIPADRSDDADAFFFQRQERRQRFLRSERDGELMPFMYPEIGVRQNDGDWTALSPDAGHVLRLVVMAYDAELHAEHYREKGPEIYKVFTRLFPAGFEDLRAAFQLDEERQFLRSAEWEMEKRVIAEEHRRKREQKSRE